MLRWLVLSLIIWVFSSHAYAQYSLKAEFEQQDETIIFSTIEPLGELAASGIRPGDHLLAINGLPVRYTVQVKTLLSKVTPQTDITLLIRRHGVVFPIRLQKQQEHRVLVSPVLPELEGKPDERAVIECILQPSLACAAKEVLGARYKQPAHQIAFYGDVIHFLVEAKRSDLATSYAKKALELYVKHYKNSPAPLYVNKAVIRLLKRLKRDIPSVWLTVVKAQKSSELQSIRYLTSIAKVLVQERYLSHASTFISEVADRFASLPAEQQHKLSYLTEDFAFIWGKAGDIATLDAWRKKHNENISLFAVHFYRGMLRAASQQNNLDLFAKGMNEGMAVAIESSADGTSEMAQMIATYSWYAGNFKGVEYVTNWLVQFVERYPESQHYVSMVYALATTYGIAGRFEEAQALIDEKLKGDDTKKWRFQGLLKVALAAAKSRGAGVVMLGESKEFAALLDRIHHYLRAMQRQNITAVKRLSPQEIGEFYILYAALNGSSYRVTAYKDTRYTAEIFAGIVDGLLEVGQLELALSWGEKMHERFPKGRKTAQAVRKIFKAYGMFAPIQLDVALLRSPLAGSYMNDFRRSRFQRLYWTGDFTKAAQLLSIMSGAKRMIVKQGVFVHGECQLCE